MSNCLKTIFAAPLLFVVALFTLFVIHNATAQLVKPPPLPLPLPQMQKLSNFYVGRWEYTETYPKSPRTPNGGINTGVYTSELGPGGNSIVNRFHSKGSVGEFDGLIVMTFDAKENDYKEYVFTDSMPGTLIETGKWEEGVLVYRAEVSMGSAMKVAMRNTARLSSEGKIVSEQFSSVNGGPESLIVHVEAVKR